jgi:hypothetical protein
MQRALTVITKISPEKAVELEALLDIIGNDIKGDHVDLDKRNTYIDFARFERIHFCRWVMIPNVDTGTKEYLLFTSNYDGPFDDHIDELVDILGETLDRIWGSCIDYPSGREQDLTKFKIGFRKYIFKHSWDYEAFYIGYRGETVKAVKRYIAFHDLIQKFLDLSQVEQFLSRHITYLVDSLPQQGGKSNAARKMLGWLQFTWTFGVFVLDLLVNLGIVFVYRPIRRRVQGREAPLNLKLSEEILDGITDIEDVVAQNQITVVSAIKPGIVEYFRVRFFLMAINLFAKHIQNKGELGGIATIHFARWAIIDNGRYLLFTSNYDGSWESYIGDFVDKAAAGMDLIWRSAPNYPKDGAADIEAFKAIIRANQVRTQVFFSAYPESTVKNVLNDRAIVKSLDRDAARMWMNKL